MKQVFTYILLFSLVVRPLFIAGHIAYYELNIDYITEKFCENKEKPELQCNGKCHLAQELAIVAADTPKQQENGVKIVTAFESFTPLFYDLKEQQSTLVDPTYSFKNKVSFFYKDCYSYSCEYSLLKPPIV